MMMDDFYPPPPQKKKKEEEEEEELENGAFWPPCRLQLFFFISLLGLGELGRLDLEIAAQCEQYQQCLFLSFKGTRD